MNTINFYNSKSSELIQKYDSADMTVLHKLFLQYLTVKSSVLDIGFGSTRDLQFLLNNNYDIWGIDPSENFVQNAQTKFPNISNQLIQSSVPFPIDKPPFPIKFDAIITIAMWMHLKKEQYKDVIKSMISITANKATIIISYSKGSRTNDERYFEDVDLKYIILLFHQKNFNLISTTTNRDSLNRDTLIWTTVVFKHD